MEDPRLRRLKALSEASSRGKAAETSAKQLRRPRIEAKIIFLDPTEERKQEKDEAKEEEKEKEKELDKRLEGFGLFPNEQEESSFVSKTITKELNLSDESEDLDEEGTDDDEDNKTLPLLRPVFVEKEARQELVHELVDDEEALKREREREAHELLVRYVRQEYQTSQQTKDELDASNFDPSIVDDTDDPEDAMELEAWRLRELLRIKRDREERERFEREKIELERIRNMTEEERRQLDEQKMKEWMEQPRSQMRFMQKYYHKGAFFMDSQEEILKRDYAQPTGEDAHANREMLPEVKQVRDFGKKGRTKWTHLVGEDTTAFDYGWGQRKNDLNYRLVSKMGGMKGHLDNPSKRPKS